MLKCNPDSPQRPVRHRALKAGKTVYLAVPKLSAKRPFIALDPLEIGPAGLWAASSVKGATAVGRPVYIHEMRSIDLVVTGCVAAARGGARLGKGGGYSDLEYALLREAGKVHRDVPVVTTVHACQLLAAGALPMDGHDVSFDVIVTPDEVVETRRSWPRPVGIVWSRLSADQVVAIPALAALRGGAASAPVG